MAREYREYRSSRSQVPKENKKKHRFFKNFLRQLIFALIIFSAIYFFKLSSSDKINGYIRNAFLYKPDTTFITDTVKNALKINEKNTPEEGAENENTEEIPAEEIL